MQDRCVGGAQQNVMQLDLTEVLSLAHGPFYQHPSYMRPQQHTVQVPNITPSADTVAAHLEALAGMPAYLRKLERKQAASEKSIRMKCKRIAELEEEVRRSVLFMFSRTARTE